MVCLSYALYFYWWEGAGPHPNSPTTSLENGPGLLQTRCVSKLRGEFEDQDHCLSLNIYIYTVYIYIYSYPGVQQASMAIHSQGSSDFLW